MTAAIVPLERHAEPAVIMYMKPRKAVFRSLMFPQFANPVDSPII